jgi:hypothetical protein
MTIESEILALQDGDGFFKPRAILNWARDNPESELHGKIEWDDAKAAEAHRLDQVRRLITIYVRTEDGDRATISLIQDRFPEGGYRQLDAVLSNSELRLMALRQAMRDYKRWETRYRHLVELSKIFEAATLIDGNGGNGQAAA